MKADGNTGRAKYGKQVRIFFGHPTWTKHLLRGPLSQLSWRKGLIFAFEEVDELKHFLATA